MQLMWLSGPLGDVRSISITRTRLLLIATVTAVMLVVAGNVVHFVGLRLAVEVRPDLVRALVGGVMTESDLEQIEGAYRQRLERLREEVAAAGRQVAELQALKDSFMQLALPRNAEVKVPHAPAAPDRSKPQAGERRNAAPAGVGGPLAVEPFRPDEVGRGELNGKSLFDDIHSSRRELRLLANWTRQARAEWSAQLAFVEALPTLVPIAGAPSVASRYGVRLDPFTRTPARHAGLDLVAPQGTPILAAATGTVLRAQYHPQYGRMVDIDHGNGYHTRYAHAQSLLVKAGDRVGRGEPIATLGSTGRSTGPHLHFELRHRGALRNPENYLPSF
jgi:murein DD-endopeptidase MepM/ murein hydrolase activator NlpD